jgi:hypothetical protein
MLEKLRILRAYFRLALTNTSRGSIDQLDARQPETRSLDKLPTLPPSSHRERAGAARSDLVARRVVLRTFDWVASSPGGPAWRRGAASAGAQFSDGQPAESGTMIAHDDWPVPSFSIGCNFRPAPAASARNDVVYLRRRGTSVRPIASNNCRLQHAISTSATLPLWWRGPLMRTLSVTVFNDTLPKRRGRR